MMRALSALALVTALAPTPAEAAGAGGVSLELRYLPRYGRHTEVAPGVVGCIGGVGYGVTRKHLRIGGEGAWCTGSDGAVHLGYGGAQIGHWYNFGPAYLSFHTGLGFGSLKDQKALAYDDRAYTSIYFYARPTIQVGVPLGPVGLEVGLFAELPFNLVQIVGTEGYGRGFVTPTVGLQTGVVFGRFKDGRKKPPPPPPLPPAPAPGPCVYPQDCDAPPPDDRPLAIPGY